MKKVKNIVTYALIICLMFNLYIPINAQSKIIVGESFFDTSEGKINIKCYKDGDYNIVEQYYPKGTLIHTVRYQLGNEFVEMDKNCI